MTVLKKLVFIKNGKGMVRTPTHMQPILKGNTVTLKVKYAKPKKDKSTIERAIGDIGERIVYEYMKEKLDASIFNVLWKGDVGEFDSVRDIILEDKSNGSRKNVEVKTQVPFFSKRAFSFRPTQLKKIKNSDIVFFVSIGTDSDKPYTNSVSDISDKLYICSNPKKLTLDEAKTRDGRKMILVPIDQRGITAVKNLTEKERLELRAASKSDLNNTNKLDMKQAEDDLSNILAEKIDKEILNEVIENYEDAIQNWENDKKLLNVLKKRSFRR